MLSLMNWENLKVLCNVYKKDVVCYYSVIWIVRFYLEFWLNLLMNGLLL